MTGVVFLIALMNGLAGLVIGWPAWRSYRDRTARDQNAERYLAWGGRADRPRPSAGGRMTAEERRRLVIGAGLGLTALACLVIGLANG